MASAAASDDHLDASRFLCCEECGARLAYDQRYCVECGVRRAPLPRAIAELIGVVPRAELGQADEVVGQRDASAASAATHSHEASSASDLSPSVAGVAVMALLAFGVLVGSAVTPAQQSRAATPIAVALSP